MIPDDDWLWIIVFVTALCLGYAQCTPAQAFLPSEPEWTPQRQARDMAVNESIAAALAQPHDPVNCYQERRYDKAHVCITEKEWLKMHIDEAVGKAP